MEAMATTSPITINLNAGLMTKIEREAKKEGFSINGYIEEILATAMTEIPNAETIAAIKEIESGKNAGTLDMSSFEAFSRCIEAL